MSNSVKRSANELAALGGMPAFSAPVHVGRPNIGDRAQLLKRIDEALDRRWLTNDGPFVRELEHRLADYLHVEHCVAVCNATVGLEVLARALGLKGEVIVPAFTFVATAHAFAWLGLQPVFCDVEPNTHTLDPDDVAKLLTPATAAVVGVHLWGNTCDVDALQKQTAQHRTPLLFDAAHAFASACRGRRVGGFGNGEVFSFHATKFFNTFEGGAITTNDASLARELKLLRNFGFAGYDAVASLGTNAKLNEISAAMGLTSLDNLDAVLELNRKRFRQYERIIKALPSCRFVPAADESNYQYVVIEVDSDRAGLTRDQLLTILWAENVRARRYFYPGCHRVPPYERPETRSLPVTERLADQVIVLPAGGSVDENNVDEIGELFAFALDHADELRDRIPPVVPPGGFRA